MGLIEGLGVDLLVPVTFDQDLGNLTAQQFVMRLYDRLNMREMVVGPGFAMGHHREGDVRTLRQIGSEAGFAVSDVDLLTDRGEDVRSTAIRNAVLEGRVVPGFGAAGPLLRSRRDGGPRGGAWNGAWLSHRESGRPGRACGAGRRDLRVLGPDR